jgi:hypothetical protein
MFKRHLFNGPAHKRFVVDDDGTHHKDLRLKRCGKDKMIFIAKPGKDR